MAHMKDPDGRRDAVAHLTSTSRNVRLPSSGTEGFFQAPPELPNPFLGRTFQRLLSLFLPASVHETVGRELAAFGALTLSPEILRLVLDAESNPPRVESLDSFGKRKDALITSEGWRSLTALHHQEGLVAAAYENKFGQYDRVYQFLKTFLWAPSSGGVTCPAAMQDGAAALSKRLLENGNGDVHTEIQPVLENAFQRLTSRDPPFAWTSGQWMTERPGGSDVQNTETLAVKTASYGGIAGDGSPLGEWEINGFKWFSSATDADMTVLLAKTDRSEKVSLFYVPVRKLAESSTSARRQLEYNGISIQRLKSKLGTKSLPTAELVLKGARGYLLGKEGQGTKEISTVLNITRIHNAISAVSAWSRALAVSTAFSRVRRANGKLLMDMPLHVKGLAQQHVQCHVYTLFTFFVVSLLGRFEHPSSPIHTCRLVPSDDGDVSRLLRLLTPLLKATTADNSLDGIRFALESLGGLGYIENSEVELNLAKLLRDTQVTSIWEGTYSVQALDCVRILTSRDGGATLSTLNQLVSTALAKGTDILSLQAKQVCENHLRSIIQVLETDSDTIIYNATNIVKHLAALCCTVMLVEDALGSAGEIGRITLERWLQYQNKSASKQDARHAAIWDRRIIFEDAVLRGTAAKL